MNIKIIKCPVYTYVNLPPLCQRFTNNSLFQRLNRVKQLGLCYYIYPSAVHTRKEHSLGVMHLTGLVIDHLRNFVSISDREKDLIQLAGLYHDIGHLAYSHMFDDYLKEVNLNELTGHITDENIKYFQLLEHEERSIHILQKVNKQLEFPLTDNEIKFIECIIMGYKPEDDDRWYLYEIVSNSLCGIDTDKMDYLYRDAYHTGLPNFQPFYIINGMRVDQKTNHIVFKEKTRIDIDDMFKTRHRMFVQVYKHHTSEKICKIYKCAMKKVGYQLYQYGIMTDDMNIETLLRNNPSTSFLMEKIDCRNLEHECSNCQEYNTYIPIKKSGGVEQVIFIQ